MKRDWWKEAVVYQIYPRSFNDSNGDGIGDLQGIIEKVDYLAELGIDVVWLNPVYESPNDDNGYDISDYRAIMDEFGTMVDWDALVDELHSRGIKLIMDLVVNHTSDEHDWFEQARTAQDNKYRDYYIWRTGEEGSPPNNWESFFGSSAWEYDEATNEYYLHLFSTKQPDLNWENPELRDKIYEMMTWWLERGIDGFRMDVINCLSKADRLPDGEEGVGRVTGLEHFVNRERNHEFLQEMNQRVLSKYDIMTVGETAFVDPEEGLKYVGEDRDELDMIFQFEIMNIDVGSDGLWGEVRDWNLTEFKEIMTDWQEKMQAGGGWNSLFLGNHDVPRLVSRFGDDGAYRQESAKMLATLLFTLQGTPYIYQGDEIGMTNFPFESIDQIDDISTLGYLKEAKKEGLIDSFEDAKEQVQYRSRDNARTPVQWDDSKHAGFTTGEPWLEVNPNYSAINVEQALQNPDSILHYYQQLINLRAENDIFIYGDYQLLLPEDESIYAYLRELNGEQLLVVLNFYEAEVEFELPEEVEAGEGKLLISNYEVGLERIDSFYLQPYEARVYEIV